MISLKDAVKKSRTDINRATATVEATAASDARIKAEISADKVFEELLSAIRTKEVGEIAILLKNEELLKRLYESWKIEKVIMCAIERGDTAIFQIVFNLPIAGILIKNPHYTRNQLLYIAARKGYAGIVKILLGVTEILNYELEHGINKALTEAEINGDLEILDIFLVILRIGEELNNRPNHYRRPFIIEAARHGQLKVINKLLTLSELRSIYHEDYQTINQAFKYAILGCHFEVAKRLMQLPAFWKGSAPLDIKSLQIPAIHGEWSIVDSLLQKEGVLMPSKEAEERARSELGCNSHTVESHYTTLMLAMDVKQYEVAYRMIQYYRRAGIALPREIQSLRGYVDANTYLINKSYFSEFPEATLYENIDNFVTKFVELSQDIQNSLLKVFNAGDNSGFTKFILDYCGFNLPLPPSPPALTTTIAVATPTTAKTDKPAPMGDSAQLLIERYIAHHRRLREDRKAIQTADVRATHKLLVAFNTYWAGSVSAISGGVAMQAAPAAAGALRQHYSPALLASFKNSRTETLNILRTDAAAVAMYNSENPNKIKHSLI